MILIKRIERKKIFKIIVSIIVVFLLYLILGAFIPFMKTMKVTEKTKAEFQLSDYLGKGTDGVDRAALVESSKEALDVRLNILNRAREKIIISSFSFKHDRSCKEIFSTVLAAADRGVKVEILADGLSGYVDMGKDPMYYVLGSHPNIEIRYYNMFYPWKPWTFHGRMHDKYIIIDDELLLLGGRNTSDYFLGEYNTKVLSYDREVLVYNTAFGAEDEENSVISQVKKYFKSVWNRKECKKVFTHVSGFRKRKTAAALKELQDIYGKLKKNVKQMDTKTDYRSMTMATDKITLISNPIHIFHKEPVLWYQAVRLMEEAGQRVYIQTPYVVLNKDMYADIKRIGQDIKEYDLITNSVAGGDNVMGSSDYTFNKKKVIDTGVRVHEFQGKHSMHNKSILIDDRLSLIGSFNLDMRSAYIDTEVMLVIDGKEFNKALEEKFLAMEKESLAVGRDGKYIPDDNVKPLKIHPLRKFIYSITSVVFQLFRFVL